MNYYDSSDTMKLLQKASANDPVSIDEIRHIQAPYAVKDDYSDMVLVQRKKAYLRQGLICWLNAQPDDDKMSICVADIYFSHGTAWSSVPIPANFTVNKVTFQDDSLSFHSDTETISGTVVQIMRGMREVSFGPQGALADDIEQSFYSIPNTIVAKPKPKKTIAQNPPIHDELIGEITFNEELQNFEAKYNKQPYSFEVYIDMDDREQVMQVLSKISEVIGNINRVDTNAKKFAAKQLLKLKNSTWREEDEIKTTKEMFISKMTVESISFDKNAVATIYYDDGDLFWGHTITVDFTKQVKPKSADIQG